MNNYSYIHAWLKATSPALLAIAALLLLLPGCFDLGAVDDNPKPQSLVEDWRDEVIYQIFTDRFADGDQNNDFSVDRTGTELTRYQGGDFRGILDHLDYLQQLGVTALWISPVVRNVEEDAGIAGYHGYWTQDFLHVNPHFGDLATLRELVAECHRRKMKVILDIVVNHVGQLFFYDINENGQPDEVTIGTGDGTRLGAPDGGAVGHVLEVDPDFDPRGVQAATSLGPSGLAPILFFHVPAIDRMPPWPAEFQNPDFYHRMGGITLRDDRTQQMLGDFPGGLKDLATEKPMVRDALVRAYQYWIDAVDFDGFRIDTVKHVEPEFFEEFSARIRAHNASRGKKNFILFGEVFSGDDDLVGSYTQNGRLDSVVYFPQKYAVVDRVFKQSGPTSVILQQHNLLQMKYSADVPPNGIGLAPRQAPVNFLDNHDAARFLYDKPSPSALRNALGYLLTTEGIPCIYYGTEQELAGGNDPGNRERLWPTGFPTQGETFQWIRSLIELRNQLPALRRGDLTVRYATDHVGTEEDAGIYAFERVYQDQKVLVVLNVSDTQTSHTALGGTPMGTDFPAGSTLHVVFGGSETVTVGPGGGVTIEVPPRGFLVFTP